jgi:hypothetical protein
MWQLGEPVSARSKHVLLAMVVALALTGCGTAYDDAQSFVDAANAEGAGFELGPSLSTSDPEHQIYALELHGGPDKAEMREPGQAHLGGGSVTVTTGDDEARLEYEECESAVSLLCYRAGNVALMLEDEVAPAERAQVDAAISALASD